MGKSSALYAPDPGKLVAYWQLASTCCRLSSTNGIPLFCAVRFRAFPSQQHFIYQHSTLWCRCQTSALKALPSLQMLLGCLLSFRHLS